MVSIQSHPLLSYGYSLISNRQLIREQSLDIRDTPASDSDIQPFNMTITLREFYLECPSNLRKPGHPVGHKDSSEESSDNDDDDDGGNPPGSLNQRRIPESIPSTSEDEWGDEVDEDDKADAPPDPDLTEHIRRPPYVIHILVRNGTVQNMIHPPQPEAQEPVANVETGEREGPAPSTSGSKADKGQENDEEPGSSSSATSSSESSESSSTSSTSGESEDQPNGREQRADPDGENQAEPVAGSSNQGQVRAEGQLQLGAPLQRAGLPHYNFSYYRNRYEWACNVAQRIPLPTNTTI